MQAQISDYMETFLSPFLCGYRKGYSAQHALLSMLEKWRISLDKGGYGGGVLMDLSKAFDTLDHDLLIAKLHAYGFEKNALRLVKSYLTDRWQRTKIDTSYISWSELLVGVPQGSVVGPIIFNLFINDLFYIIKTNICNYADDNTPSNIMPQLEQSSLQPPPATTISYDSTSSSPDKEFTSRNRLGTPPRRGVEKPEGPSALQPTTEYRQHSLYN